MDARYGQWVDAYALALLRWALSKTGAHHLAEDLAQEVWLQFFLAVAREEKAGRTIREPEHLLWRVAKYVWCKQLRTLRCRQLPPLPAGIQEDFASALAEEDEQRHLTAWLHRRIVNLSRLQREIMILYYIDQLPQKDIAARLNLSQGAVRWHLFDTRRRLREEHQTMPTTADYVYRPGRMCVAVCGTPPPQPDTLRIDQSLLMQNILMFCYPQPRTVQEIAAALGVASAFVENDLQWLVEKEFITEEKGRYATAFIIEDVGYNNAVTRLFFSRKEEVSLAIVRYLLEKEQAIRALGFTGCHQPMEKLLWLLIYHFTYYLPLPLEKPTPPLRPDGGHYHPHGYVQSTPEEPNLREHWAYNGSMEANGFCWFGLYTFGRSDIESLMDSYTMEWHALRLLLQKLAEHGFDLGCVAADEQYHLALLVEKGFVRMHSGMAEPNFVIFTQEQYDRLRQEIFAPLARQLQPALAGIARDLHSLSLGALPQHLRHLVPLDEALAMMDIGFMTEFIAFKEGYLYKPEKQREGEFLTMCYLMP